MEFTQTLLIMLLCLVDHIPLPKQSQRLGRPTFYNERIFLKAIIVMILKDIHTVYGFLTILEQPAPEMRKLRELLSQENRFPARRTWERRLKTLPEHLPGQIGYLGRYLVTLIQPFNSCGRACAIDSTILRAKGGVWHNKDREKGEVPHSSIDTQAHWTKSGWHGWVYGWKLHIVTTVAAVWIPLAAKLTSANEADNMVAPDLLPELPAEIRFVLGDQHYNAPNVEKLCQQAGRILVASSGGSYPKNDSGKEVRKIFHKMRSIAIENFNEHFKTIFDGHAQVPTKGRTNTQRFALGAIFVYQIVLLYRFQNKLSLRQGLKPFIKAA